MTSQTPVICMSCTRATISYIPGTQTGPADNTGTPTIRRCTAYPDGIPDDILLGGDHRVARGDERGGWLFRQTGGAESGFSSWQRFHDLMSA